MTEPAIRSTVHYRSLAALAIALALPRTVPAAPDPALRPAG
jgi:hypothetical protein